MHHDPNISRLVTMTFGRLAAWRAEMAGLVVDGMFVAIEYDCKCHSTCLIHTNCLPNSIFDHVMIDDVVSRESIILCC